MCLRLVFTASVAFPDGPTPHQWNLTRGEGALVMRPMIQDPITRTT